MPKCERIALYANDAGRSYRMVLGPGEDAPETHRMRDGEVLPRVMVMRAEDDDYDYPLTRAVVGAIDAAQCRRRTDGAARFGAGWAA